MTDSHFKDLALHKIAPAQAGTALFEQAIETVNRIKTPHLACKACLEIYRITYQKI